MPGWKLLLVMPSLPGLIASPNWNFDRSGTTVTITRPSGYVGSIFYNSQTWKRLNVPLDWMIRIRDSNRGILHVSPSGGQESRFMVNYAPELDVVLEAPCYKPASTLSTVRTSPPKKKVSTRGTMGTSPTNRR